MTAAREEVDEPSSNYQRFSPGGSMAPLTVEQSRRQRPLLCDHDFPDILNLEACPLGDKAADKAGA